MDEGQFINAVCQRVGEIRRAHALSQEKLAERIGLDVRELQRIEAGDREPRLRILFRIARALDISIEHFFTPPRQPRARS